MLQTIIAVLLFAASLFFLLGLLGSIANIGQPRKPLTSQEASRIVFVFVVFSSINSTAAILLLTS